MRGLLQVVLLAILALATLTCCHGAPIEGDTTIVVEEDLLLRGVRMEEDDQEESQEDDDEKDSDEEEDDEDKDSEESDDDKDSEESDDELFITPPAPKPIHVPVLVGDDEVALAGGNPVLTPEEGEVQQQQILLKAPEQVPTTLSRRLVELQEPLFHHQPSSYKRVVFLHDEEEDFDEEQDEEEYDDPARLLSLPTNTLYGWHGSWKHSRPIVFYPEKNLYNKYDKHSIKSNHYDPHAITYHHGFYTGLY